MNVFTEAHRRARESVKLDCDQPRSLRKPYREHFRSALSGIYLWRRREAATVRAPLELKQRLEKAEGELLLERCRSHYDHSAVSILMANVHAIQKQIWGYQ